MDPVTAKRYKFALRREFTQRKKWKATQLRDACAKLDFSAAKWQLLTEMQPYVITVDDSLAWMVTMSMGAVMPDGGREDAYQMELQIIARSTQPCVEVFAAGDSLAAMAGDRTGSQGSFVRLQHVQIP